MQSEPTADRPNDDDTSSAPSSLRQAWVVFMMTLILVFSFLDRGILALLVQPIQADLSLSDTQMSLLLGLAFASFYALLGVPFGIIADRGNRVRLIGVGLFLFTLATALSGRAKSFLVLFLLRMGVGVGEATLGPAAPSIITDTVPRKRLATAMSVYMTGAYIGAGLASLIGGVLAGVAMRIGTVEVPLLGTVKPWQMVFLFIGLAGFVPLLLLTLTVREPVRRGVAAKEPPPSFQTIRAHYARHGGTFFFHHLGFAALAFSGYGVGSWLPTFMIRTHGWSIEKVGLWFGVNGMVTAVAGVLTGGWLADRWAERGWNDSKIRVALLGSLVWFPFGIAYPLLESDIAAFAAIVGATFLLHHRGRLRAGDPPGDRAQPHARPRGGGLRGARELPRAGPRAARRGAPHRPRVRRPGTNRVVDSRGERGRAPRVDSGPLARTAPVSPEPRARGQRRDVAYGMALPLAIRHPSADRSDPRTSTSRGSSLGEGRDSNNDSRHRCLLEPGLQAPFYHPGSGPDAGLWGFHAPVGPRHLGP